MGPRKLGVVLVVVLSVLAGACAAAPEVELPDAPVSEDGRLGATRGQLGKAVSPATPPRVPTTTAPAAPLAPPTTVAPTTTVSPTPSPAGFVHPGVGLDRVQLDRLRANIGSGREPWTTALAKLRNSGMTSVTPLRPKAQRFSSLAYVPAPVSEVRCMASAGTSYAAARPELGLTNNGCLEQTDDAAAAYAHALLWAATGDEAHARKSIEIMDAWSGTLREILFASPVTASGDYVYSNGKLQAGWAAQLMTRAAEIVRHTYGKWDPASVARFSRMLDQVFLPLVVTGWSNGANWMMTFADATMGIGVFNDDRSAFDAGVAMWRAQAPTTIYLPSDGPQPLAPASWLQPADRMKSYWYRPSSYVSGLQGETLRDLSHSMMGLAALSTGAETARIQGVDLFGEQQRRIVAGYELNAGFVNQYLDEVQRLGAAPPSTWRPVGWPGEGDFRLGGQGYMNGWELALAHYSARGVDMPQTRRVAERTRPAGPGLHMSWDTLAFAR